MSRFVAFDVEMPNRMSNRMSAIGITVIEDGRRYKLEGGMQSQQAYKSGLSFQGKQADRVSTNRCSEISDTGRRSVETVF